MLKKIISLSLIALIIVSMSNASTILDLTIINKDTGSSKIADIGHAEIYDHVHYTDYNHPPFGLIVNKKYDIKKGDSLKVKANLTTNYEWYGNHALEPYYLAEFDTQTLHRAYLTLMNSNMDWGDLPEYIGNLSMVVEVRQFNGRTQYTNKVDYVRINSDKLGEVLKVGSPSILDKQKVYISIINVGDKFCFHLETNNDYQKYNGPLFKYQYD